MTNQQDRRPATSWFGVLREYVVDKLLEILATASLIGSLWLGTHYPDYVVLAWAITAGLIVGVLTKRYRSY